MLLTFWRARQSYEGLQLLSFFMIIVLLLLIIDWVTLSPKRFNPEAGD